MTVDWTRQLLGQFDVQWNLAHGPSLETLTDQEYLWEPVPGCWSIRPTGPGGRGEIEQTWPDPGPAPVTTIAWRLSHLAVGVFGLRASHHFGDGSLTHANAERPLTAKEGVAYFTEQVLRWRWHIERLDEEGLARPAGWKRTWTPRWRRSSCMSTGRHSTTWRRCRCCGTSTGRPAAHGSPDAAMA
jgi:DinB family protein